MVPAKVFLMIQTILPKPKASSRSNPKTLATDLYGFSWIPIFRVRVNSVDPWLKSFMLVVLLEDNGTGESKHEKVAHANYSTSGSLAGHRCRSRTCCGRERADSNLECA